MRIPVATYRVQFSRAFRFVDASRIVPYLHDLGITDLYASPILQARRGSTHGYDVTNPGNLNPEVGTPEEFEELVLALQNHQMGLIVDIVPNHMAAGIENPWWFDMLEKGEVSPYASFFDVDWTAKKVLLPILSKPYGEALENDELKLALEDGRIVLQYGDLRLPVAAGEESSNLDAVDWVLSRQHYRLAFWRKLADSVNYRRFFDVSDLVALRAERDDVFEASHQLVLNLVRAGKVTGLRIDHIDGLIDPQGYLQRLPDVYVVVEKILGGNEDLPKAWKAQGTTGYDFLNAVNGPFVDPAGYEALRLAYVNFAGSAESYMDTFRSRKHQVMKQLFGGEVNALVRRLTELAEKDRHARDATIEELKVAFTEVTACLPVYRTYVRETEVTEIDRAVIRDCIAAAAGPKLSTAYAFLQRVLLLEPAGYLKDQLSEYLDFVMRWQQFTGPVMAKGMEDTTFYIQNALVSVNEVGGNSGGPEVFFGVEEFHRRNAQTRARQPATMNASSTHDTKRSEDVRARINVLSELPHEWQHYLRRWSRMNPSETAPDPNEQILIYQTLLGAWPLDSMRLKEFVTKALREAKTHTSWIQVDEDYENRVMAFIDRILPSPAFIHSFLPFQKKVAHFGALSSLSQLVLKIASPGVPDFYRGTELWDLSLTDPDNRRPVDFDERMRMLSVVRKRSRPSQMMKKWADGRIKMFITWSALNFRREHSELFLEGDYIPLKATGAAHDHVVAFARRLKDDWVVAAVPRLLATLGKNVWGDTKLEFPAEAPQNWVNIFTGEEPGFDAFPYMLLTPAEQL